MSKWFAPADISNLRLLYPQVTPILVIPALTPKPISLIVSPILTEYFSSTVFFP